MHFQLWIQWLNLLINQHMSFTHQSILYYLFLNAKHKTLIDYNLLSTLAFFFSTACHIFLFQIAIFLLFHFKWINNNYCSWWFRHLQREKTKGRCVCVRHEPNWNRGSTFLIDERTFPFGCLSTVDCRLSAHQTVVVIVVIMKKCLSNARSFPFAKMIYIFI